MANERDEVKSQADEAYGSLLQVEDLESLLEEIEEGGWDGAQNRADLPDDLQTRLEAAGVHNATELRQEIARQHAILDAEEDWD